MTAMGERRRKNYRNHPSWVDESFEIKVAQEVE